MIKVGDKVEILDSNSSRLKVGSHHVVTEIRGWREHERRIVGIDKWLFPTDCLKKVKERKQALKGDKV